MWFIGVEVEQETSAPPPKKNPGSVPAQHFIKRPYYVTKYNLFLFVCFWRNLGL